MPPCPALGPAAGSGNQMDPGSSGT